MIKKKILLVGGGGHCKSCIDVIEQTGQYEISGIIDVPEKLGQITLGYSVIANDDDIEMLAREGYYFVITMGQIKSAAGRIRLYERLLACNANIETIISPKAYVSKHAEIGKGTVIMHNVVINSDALVGENCILNTGCIVEHDAVIGAHTHLSTNSVVNGGSSIGTGNFVGSGAIISSGVHTVANSVFGASATVVRNIEEAGTYIGSPAKKIK